MAMQQIFIEAANSTNDFKQRVPTIPRTYGYIAGHAFSKEHLPEAQQALGWQPADCHLLPTSEVSTMMLRPGRQNSQAQPNVSCDCPSDKSAAWCRYLSLVADWLREHPQLTPYPITLHLRWDGEHPVHEAGAIHLYFGGGSAQYDFSATVNGRHVAFRHAHLYVGELGPQHVESIRLIPQLLSSYLPRVIGESWYDTNGYTALSHQVSALQKKPYVHAVLNDGQEISVFTSQRATVTIPPDRSSVRAGTYDIGEFQINFPLRGDRMCTLHNLSRQGREWQHPNVSCPHGPCLGNYYDPIRKLLEAEELSSAFDRIWLFLNSVSNDRLAELRRNFPRFSKT